MSSQTASTFNGATSLPSMSATDFFPGNVAILQCDTSAYDVSPCNIDIHCTLSPLVMYPLQHLPTMSPPAMLLLDGAEFALIDVPPCNDVIAQHVISPYVFHQCLLT